MTELRAVVIEDDPDIALLIATIMEGMGYIVRTAQTGPAGIHAVRAANPAVITTDLGLPEMHGLEVITTIRRQSTAPILVISAERDPGTAEHALATGANSFLSKPFRPAALRALIEDLQR